MEYASLQQQVLISSHHEESSFNNDQHFLSPMTARISSDEPRISNDSTRGDIDSHSVSSSSQDTTSSPPYNKKNSMAGFITQMRSQLANAAAAGDPSKLTARLAKLKKEITDTGNIGRGTIK
jgi:hypothetical protein